MAIRLEDAVSAQLTMLAQFEATTVAELIRQAIESLIATKSADPELSAKASAVLEAIDAEASAKRQAIERLLASDTPTVKRPTGRRGSS